MAGDEAWQCAGRVSEVQGDERDEQDAGDDGGGDESRALGHGGLSGQREDGDAQRAGDSAVHGERGQAVGLKEAHEETHGEVGGDRVGVAPTSAGPRTPAPLLPSSSGSFRAAAAPMIGVASRNENRAASSFERPTSSPALMGAPEGEKPGSSAIACAVPTQTDSRKPTWRAIRSSL